MPIDVERISTPAQIARLAQRLGVRPDWHEPDEQEVTARVFGVLFDNAGFYGGGPHRITEPDS